jgi:hypothetical protein
MSARSEDQAAAAQLANLEALHDDQSDVGDGSSSLSDIEQDPEQDDEQDDLDDNESSESSESEDIDSEAETERLHNSPTKQQPQKDVVLSSRSDARTFETLPSNLSNQYQADSDDDGGEDNEDTGKKAEEDVSDDELSLPDSPGTAADEEGAEGDQEEPPNEPTRESPKPLQDIMHSFDLTNKKRKRSQLLDRDAVDIDDGAEPSRKRTGSLGAGKDFAVEDDASGNEDDDNNPDSADLSEIDPDEDEQDLERDDDDRKPDGDTQNGAATAETQNGRRKSGPNGLAEEDATNEANGNKPAGEAEIVEDVAEVEVDEAEAALKDEEEGMYVSTVTGSSANMFAAERKKVALEQLSDIEKHFSSFRDRLYEERLAKLNHEEWLLKQDPPQHPEFLDMIKGIDARRDHKLNLERRRVELMRETIEKVCVAERSAILSQFYQDVRAIRERKLDELGKQWYDIQHDRRSFGNNVEDYAIPYPIRKTEQLRNQYAYNTEVSVLSGIARHVGFPAAPPMAPATVSEIDDDFKKMGVSRLSLRLSEVS